MGTTINSHPSITRPHVFSYNITILVALACALLLSIPATLAQSPGSAGETAFAHGKVDDSELHKAAFRGEANTVERLLEDGADVNQTADDGNSALHMAAYNGHSQVVALLIEHGAYVRALNYEGNTPLDLSRSNGHSKTEQLLLAHGAVADQDLAVRSRSEPEDLEAVARVTALWLKKYRAHAGQTAGSDKNTEPSQIQYAQTLQSNTSQKASSQTTLDSSKKRYRVQLAAMGIYEGAVALQSEYKQTYREILGERKLVIDEISTPAERTLYKLRSEALSEREAYLLCLQLRRNDQDCFVTAQPD